MIVTLWTNAKARNVTKTEVTLGRQDDGDERFQANGFSRGIVYGALTLGRWLSWLTPSVVKEFIERRFKRTSSVRNRASFDLIRAAVNLLVASALIAYGTSQHLPLSTTFVTFMVAMGSSLADRAWGLDSAVYRVAGVLAVIGGWLTTALVAFLSAAVMATILSFTGFVGVVMLSLAAMLLLIRSHIQFRERTRAAALKLPKHAAQSFQEFVEETSQYAGRQVKSVMVVYQNTVKRLLGDAELKPAAAIKELARLKAFHEKVHMGIIKAARRLNDAQVPAGKVSIQVFDITQDLAQSIDLVFSAVQQYRVNLHPVPSGSVVDRMRDVEEKLTVYLKRIVKAIAHPSLEKLPALQTRQQELNALIELYLETQMRELQEGKTGNRLASLQIKILLETQDIAQRAYQLAVIITNAWHGRNDNAATATVSNVLSSRPFTSS